MIRWCAYCQTYQGEAAPFDGYALTHTICPDCFARGAFDDGDLSARIAPIARFYAKVAGVATRGAPSAEALLDEGLALGLAPFDLVVGVLQPALYDVGQRWERGEITYRDEHRLTAVCAAMLDRLEARTPALAALRSGPKADVVLAGLSCNTHSVGLRIVELFLLASGVRVRRVEGRSVEDVVRAVREARPSVVGFGVTLLDQLPAALETAERVASGRDPARGRPRILFGGAAFRAGARLPESAPGTVCDDFRDVLALVRAEGGGGSD